MLFELINNFFLHKVVAKYREYIEIFILATQYMKNTL